MVVGVHRQPPAGRRPGDAIMVGRSAPCSEFSGGQRARARYAERRCQVRSLTSASAALRRTDSMPFNAPSLLA